MEHYAVDVSEDGEQARALASDSGKARTKPCLSRPRSKNFWPCRLSHAIPLPIAIVAAFSPKCGAT